MFFVMIVAILLQYIGQGPKISKFDPCNSCTIAVSHQL